MNYMTIRELMKLFKEKKLSPREIADRQLERIAAERDAHIFITVCGEIAMRQAAIAEQRYMSGEQTGMLEGVPLTYKDNIWTRGLRTTNGSDIDSDFVPEEDAQVVSTLQGEGAVNLGKVNMHEYAFGITSNNPFYGPVRNPWHSAYTAGGSSGGSAAAVALSLGEASIGTDTAGSIRIPAASCGVIGIKPTYGLVSTKRITPISKSLDHAGPIAGNVDDAAYMLEVMTDGRYCDALTEDIKGLRIGVPANYFNENVSEWTLAQFSKALKIFEHLGAILFQIEIPYTHQDLDLSFAIGIPEAGVAHEKSIQSKLDSFGDDVRGALRYIHSIPAVSYIKALQKREEISWRFDKLFDNIDLIAAPTIPDTAQKIGKETLCMNGKPDSVYHAMIKNTAVFNLTGMPAISVPYPETFNGLPSGFQLAGAHYSERVLLKASYAYEQACLAPFYLHRSRLR